MGNSFFFFLCAVPQDLWLPVSAWVEHIDDVFAAESYKIFHMTKSKYINLCLIFTGFTNPFPVNERFFFSFICQHYTASSPPTQYVNNWNI